MLFFVVIPRLPAPAWTWRFAADPLPASFTEAHARYARRLAIGRVLTREALEQVWLLALLCVIFTSILPGIDATVLQVVVGIAAIVLANAAISLAAARRGGFGLESAAARYAALLTANLALVYLASALLSRASRLRPRPRAVLRVPDHDHHLALRRIPARVRPASRNTRRAGASRGRGARVSVVFERAETDVRARVADAHRATV